MRYQMRCLLLVLVGCVVLQGCAVCRGTGCQLSRQGRCVNVVKCQDGSQCGCLDADQRTYGVTRDSWYGSVYDAYPVSHRNKDVGYEINPME